MILIADSGSTKTSWFFVGEDGKKQNSFSTEGYNPFFVDSDYIKKSLEEKLPEDLEQDKVAEVNFYGAGCMGEKTDIVKDAMQRVFKNSIVNAHMDLVAAARALLGVNAGFAAILGTGTNSCLYNGKEITHHIDSLGYILGDEGSGCAIGKRLLSDYLRGYMPAEIRDDFESQYQLNPDDVMDRIYSNPLVSRYCAGFTRYLTEENIKNEYLYKIVKECFSDFFLNLVSHYPNYQEYTFNCVGSIGYNFRGILEEVSTEYNMKPGNIIQSPLEGLVKYHVQELAKR